MRDLPASRTLLTGGVVANLAAVACVLVSVALASRGQGFWDGALVLFNLGAIPAIVGLTATWWWRKLPLTLGQLSLHTGWLAGLGLLGAAIAFREGILCLAMAAPFYYAILWIAVQAGYRLFRNDPSRLRVSVIPLLMIGAVAETRLSPEPSQAVFTDELRIAASPSGVWPHVVSFPPIASPPDFWFFRFGLPYPMETPPGADAVGKERLCVFSQGVVFRERVAVFDPGRRLRFEIVQQPDHPELLGHFETHWGEFELRPEPDGTTTLIGRSCYTLHTRPRWYFDLWVRHLGRAVHCASWNMSAALPRLVEAPSTPSPACPLDVPDSGTGHHAARRYGAHGDYALGTESGIGSWSLWNGK
ncbi:MAG: hypothetical protein KIT22_05055 [Verrucomicrobiae bacterium]|nr:hypothetical protein [Verrucomicrobiae bacterium]